MFTITHYIPKLDFSGQPINMLKVARGQQQCGHTVKIRGSYVNDFWSREKGHVKATPNLERFNGGWSFTGEEYDLGDPDILFYWGPEDEGTLQYLAKTNVPKVRVVGQIYPFAMSDKYLDIFDAFICFTELQAEILSYIPKDKLYIIGAPIDTENIQVKTHRNADKFIIGKLGYAGSKVYEELPTVIDLLNIPSLRCRIVGPEYSAGDHKWGSFDDPLILDKLTDSNRDKIDLHIPKVAEPVFDNPYFYYSEFDVYIAATSTQSEGLDWASQNEFGQPAPPIETFCTTALEAMACGVPIVVEEKGCVKEWVRHGIDGYVASSPEDYAKYISKLYNDIDLYYTMSKAARKRAEDFDTKIIADKYNKVCLDVINSSVDTAPAITKHPLVLYCKSFRDDRQRIEGLLESIQKYNKDNIPVYISVPSNDIELFKHFETNYKINLISDESISTPSLEDGWLNQQVIKSEFWKLGHCDNYVVLDSDAYFIKNFYIQDFMYNATTPYTVMHQCKDLFQHTANINFKDPKQNFLKDRRAIQDKFDRPGKAFDFGPSPVIWSTKVWESLQKNYLEPNNLTFEDLISIQAGEFIWYGEWLLSQNVIDLIPIEPLFKVFHYRSQWEEAQNLGHTEKKIAENYIGIIMNSNWKLFDSKEDTPLKF